MRMIRHCSRVIYSRLNKNGGAVMKQFSLVMVLLMLAFLYSCGGGGGGATPPSVGQQPPPQSPQPSQPPVVQPAAASITISGLVQSLPPNYESSIKTQQQANQSYINIVNAVITVKSSCDSVEKMIFSDDQGKFSLPDLKVCAPGYIIIKAEKDGFVRFEKTIRFDKSEDLKDISLQALIDPVNTKVIDVSKPIYSQDVDDFVTIAVVQDNRSLRKQILSGDELKYQLRKNSNLQIVWQFDIRRSLLKQQGVETLIANVQNYDPLNQEHMKKFPSDYDDKGNRLVTGGFDFLEIRKDDNTPLTLSPASKSSISSQAFPTNYRFKRLIDSSLIKCDSDTTKPGLQIGFYAMLGASWKLIGYGTVYDSFGNILNSLSDVKSGNSYYIILTDADLLIETELFNYYNFDYVLETCAEYKTVNIKVDLVDQKGFSLDSTVYVYKGNSYIGYGKTNQTFTTGYFTDNTGDISIRYYDPYTYQYIDVKNNKNICQEDSSTDPKHDGNTNFHYKCKTYNPYPCKISGKLLRDNETPYKNAYVTSDIAKWGVYTNADGEYTLDVKCEEKGYVKVYRFGKGYENLLSFNVNGIKDESEIADYKEKAVLPDMKLPNQSPYVYIYSYQNTVKVGKSLTLYSYAYDPDGDKITYTWSATCGTFDNPSNSSPTWTAPNSETKCTLTLKVTNSHGGESEKSIDINVSNNRAPVISYAYSSKTAVKKGEDVYLYAWAYDPDGDDIFYEWQDSCGGSFESSRSFSTKWTAPSTAGSCTLTLTVSDGSKSTSKTVSVKVGFPPVISSITVPATASVGDTLQFSVTASDADGDSLTYTWKVNGVNVCNTKDCSYKVGTAGTITVEVEVKDSDGNTARASRTITVGKSANTEITVQGRK